MKSADRFAELLSCNSVPAWRDLIFKFGEDLGYEQTLLAILHDCKQPVEAEFAFLHSNYSPEWRSNYDADMLHLVDPTFMHCTCKTTPLIWSPDIFSTHKQKQLYEEACGYGIRAGITLPIHGAQGEMGILCFVSDVNPGKTFQQEALDILPTLSYFRDLIFETSLNFIALANTPEIPSPVTPCELECLKWCAAGKSSWEIGQILLRSENTINFHFSNLRRKFSVSSRQQVVVKAMRLGLISP